MRLSWLVMVASAIADTVMTIYSVGIYGLEIEGNPIIKYIMEWIGHFPGIFLWKTICIGIITYVVNTIPKDYSWLYYLASVVWFFGAFSHVVILMN